MKERLLAAVTILVASVGVGAQNEARVSAITAAQQKIAREFAASDLSPFTAVASRYFSGGDAARVVVRGDAVSFEDVSSADGSADVSFDGRDIWVAPVPGGMTLSLSKKRGDEGVEPGTGTPVNAHTRVGDREVIRLGRYYLETGARPGSGRAIVYDPQASLRKAFNGLHWFPASTALQLPATFAPIERPDAIIVTTSRGLQKEYFRVGVFSFQIEGKVLRLVALALSPAPKPGEELFVPFRDATTGRESYAVGRYLNVAFKGARVPYLLDFNLATNPYCAYSPHYNCVIPPKENTLAAPIRAGEMIYATHAEERSPQAMAAGLAAWEFVTDPPVAIGQVCAVHADGVLAVTGSPVGYLATVASHRDYRVHAEWRWTGAPGNSGLLLHISSGPKDRQWPTCFQVQWKNKAAGDLLPMAGARFSEALSTPPDAKTPQLTRSGADSERPAGQWNECDVVCRGDVIEVTINGVLQNRVTGVSVAEGKVGVQLEGTPFELRNVSITPLR